MNKIYTLLRPVMPLVIFALTWFATGQQTASAQCAGTYTINIGACASFLDEVCFEIRNASNTAVFGGAFCPVNTAGTFNYVASGTAPDNGPFTFFIETQGNLNDNCATYSVSCNSSTLVTGSLAAGLTFTSAPFCCAALVGCTNATNGQWPTTTFTPTCTGTPQAITTIAYTSEYSVVAVTSGTAYTFSSSVGTHYITISDATGTTVYATGTGSVTWTASITGNVRFYTHLSSACDGNTATHTRSVSCAPPGCLAATYGQWPGTTFVPTCSGSPEVITAIGWAGEYSVVTVSAGTTYTFTSSVATDYITIGDAGGTTTLASGTGSVTWTATLSGNIRFYTHLSGPPTCGASTASRTRSVSCSPAGCLTAVYGQYPSGTFTPTCNGTAQPITTIGWASEYSVVAVTAATQYTFTSSVATDFITISNDLGTVVLSSGIGSVTWTANITGTVRFYTHLDAACGASTASRTRSVSCFAYNDLCANALPLTCGQTVTGTTVGASNVGNGPLCTTAASTAGSLWYTFTANNQNVTLSMCAGTGYDSKIFVYTGSCGAFTCLIGDDDGCGTLQSTVSFAAINGVTYYVMVAGFGTATGAFTLTATCSELPPPAANDECSTAISLTIPSCGTYSTVGATDSPDAGPQCFDNEFGNSYYTDGDVWFSFVMPPSGWVTLTADNISFFAFVGGTPIAPLGIEIYSGTCTGFGGGAGPFCNQAQTGAGFPSDPACAAAICAADPFCCATQWDGICASSAALEPACANCLTGAGSSNVTEQCEILWDNQADEMLFNGVPGQTYIVRVWDLFSPLEQEAFDLCIEETQPNIQSCNETFTDTGGAAGNYADLERKWYIICGDNVGVDKVKVTFNTFQIEANFDFMTVWDSFGPSATPLAADATGNDWQGTTFEATNPSGCLTFFFESDNIITDIGWEADVRCVCPQVISTPAAYTDFMCDGESPDFAAAEATIGYQNLQGAPADGSAFIIKWFLNAAYTNPAPPNYTIAYSGSGCAPQTTFLYARGTCSTGEFFDAGFMAAIVYPTPEQPTLVLTNQGAVGCSYAFAPPTCAATSFAPAPTNTALGTPAQTVTVTATNGGCTATYQITKPACDDCYVPSTITGSACEGLPADFAAFEAALSTTGFGGVGAVNWYYDAAYTNQVDESAPLNIEVSGCSPINVTLYALGTCATGTVLPAGQINLTFFPAPEPPVIVANNNICTYSYAPAACPGTTFLTPLTNEAPGTPAQTIPVQVQANGCVYSFNVTKPLCEACDLGSEFTLIYEAGTSTSSFFNYGQINLTGSFVAPLFYTWSTQGYVTYGVPTTGSVNVLYADDAVFSVTITDAVGCFTVYTNLPTGINDLSIINSVITSDNGSASGAINLTVVGGTLPYTYSWSGPSGFTAATEDISGLASGWYVVNITSSDGQTAFGWYWVPKQVRGRGKGVESASITAMPNPFSAQTNLMFSVPDATQATITLYGVNGQLTRELFTGNVEGGETVTLPISADDLPAGMYIARLTTATGIVENYKLVISK